MIQEPKEFTTLDAYLAGWLKLKKFPYQLRRGYDGKIVFAFDDTPEFRDALIRYRSGAMVEAFSYAQTIKDLRAELYEKREEGQGDYQNGKSKYRRF